MLKLLKNIEKTIRHTIKYKIIGKIKILFDYFYGYYDYFNFPFNISKPMPSNAVEILEKGCKILESLNINYSLADGTLLGIIRDNQLIPHDTDIDINVLHPVDTKIIENEFIKYGFKVGRRARACGKVQQLVFYSENEVLFDILFYTQIGEDLYCFSEKDFYFKHPKSHYEKFITYEFNGYKYYIPKQIEEWLECTYGKNWKTPKTSKPNDWRNGDNEYMTAVAYSGKVSKLVKNILQRKT